ncbi:MAG TPA: ricin-type beta-trefoil lectin domain protein [Labilithrix sp.]|nr:ricin-type beta-trefoil lectin domain protein [Labilithrix sp.]
MNGEDGDGRDGRDEDGRTPENAPALTTLAVPGVSYCKGATPLVAFVGGSSIALRWSTLPGKPDGVREYKVYRNGTNIGAAKPEFHWDFPEKDGKGFIDKDIAPGASYEYRVEAIAANGAATDVGAPLCVVAPNELAPPPVIALDYSKAPDLESVMLTGKAFLEIWYPKVVLALALPEYSPRASFRIELDPTIKNSLQAIFDEGLIQFRPDFLRNARQDMGAFLHEATHLIDAPEMIGWMDEGIADWTREYMLHDRDPVPIGPEHHYTQGHSQGAFFLNWIQDTYKKPLLHELVVGASKGVPFRQVLVDQTGKNLEPLWEQLTGRKERGPGPIRFTSLANKCIEAGDQFDVRVGTCNGSAWQDWMWKGRDVNDGTVMYEGPKGCLDVSSSGTANGTRVIWYPCNGSGAQAWKRQANGTLLNPQSGRCLDNPNGSTVDGTKLQIWDCNGGAGQQFTLPD